MGIIVPAIRVICFSLLVASTVCVLIGRQVCFRAATFLFRTDWNCNSREVVTIHDWHDAGIDGQWFVFIASIIVAVYFAVFAIFTCLGSRFERLEVALSALASLVLLSCGALEAYYAAQAYQRRLPGYRTEGYVQSYIAASVGYFLAAIVAGVDALAVFKGK